MEYITASEKEQLEQKLSNLISQRKVITERIAEARELGDLKENAEYHAAREDQGQNEAKIRDLEDRLANAQIADDADVPEGMVFLGTTVKLKDVDSGEEELYRLVGEASGDLTVDYIEVTTSSPMGVALMKSHVGETVRVDLPRGERHYEIVEIV
ncbi:MAG: transcription elongation factor GreA [Phycisphaerae bacterium]|nr:transcription elongation factor GreA [Phycisphaerae bacterium]